MARHFLVIDDHPMMREAIRSTLGSLAPQCLIEDVSTLDEAMVRLEQSSGVELTLLDLHLPDCGGLEGLKELRDRFPDNPVVVMSAEVDSDTILRCIDLGACGFIPKTHRSDAVLNALRLVTAGDIYIPHQAVSQIAARQQLGPLRAKPNARGLDPRELGLTERQIDVLRLILRGFSNKLICRQLKLAEGTIKVHVSAVLRALGVSNRTQAIIAASQLGLKLVDRETPSAVA